jgi:RNA polymerase sigma factor (sigma-70 family)
LIRRGIVGAPADWWWNPLTYVTDEVKADILADVFTTASRDVTARTDAFFDTGGQTLLANLLLAAANAGRALTQVYLWLSDPSDDEPVELLEQHGYALRAAALRAVVNAPEKQRGGLYGTAQQIASFMTNREAMCWVTDDDPAPRAASSGNPWLAAARRREFDPREFVKTSGTVYSLSKEGRGSAGPIVTALTVTICEAAEEHAKRSPGGRLAVPMVAVLDEAANVCRWRELPNLQSHYGSRGICLMTILQSWSQGVEVWGRDGMRKLWSAANVKVYGGGVSEVEFLSELSQLVGDFDLNTTSVSHGRGGRSTNRAVRRERVLDVADLSTMPKGRAVVFASGAPATLVRTLPLMTGPRASEVRASIAFGGHRAATRQRGAGCFCGSASRFGGQRNLGVMQQRGLSREQFDELYAAEAEQLLVFLTRRTLDPESGLDLWAETLAQAFAGRRRFRGDASQAPTWLYGIAYRQLAMFWRRGAVERRALRRIGLERPVASEDQLQHLIRMAGLEEIQTRVRAALDDLPPAQREAVRLRVIDELPYSAIALRLGVREDAARARVSRALRALAAELNPCTTETLEVVR